MNKAILHRDLQEFIDAHLYDDIPGLLLKGMPFQQANPQEIVEQIEAKLRCKKKLPTWFQTPQIYYPNKLNIEQCSSEIAANYKAQLFSGTSLIDLTGGFGVDAYMFSKTFNHVTHCEINPKLSAMVRHNFNVLGVDNVTTIADDGIGMLSNSDKTYDWIYIDPSRRHDSKGKVFFLKDCLPNVPDHLDILFKHAPNIAIKTAPLLDVSMGIQELDYVKAIHIVAINNEVKELLWLLQRGYKSDINMTTVNITGNKKDVFEFPWLSEAKAFADFSHPLSYLYEPNAALLKSGAFNTLAQAFQLAKLHQHSHLYTSSTLIEEFPGRSFHIDQVINYSKKALKRLGISKANITTRNFKESVSQIRKKHGISDGGNTYLFFTTNCDNEKIVLVCSKAS